VVSDEVLSNVVSTRKVIPSTNDPAGIRLLAVRVAAVAAATVVETDFKLVNEPTCGAALSPASKSKVQMEVDAPSVMRRASVPPAIRESWSLPAEPMPVSASFALGRKVGG
jgi:hypothetical protein